MWSSRSGTLRGGMAAGLALALGAGLGWIVISGHSKDLLAIAGLLGIIAIFSVPLGVMTQAFVFVSQAFPKAGKFLHGIPIDVGVVLSLLVLAKWGLTALVSPNYPHERPRGAYPGLLLAWVGWMAYEFLAGVLHGAHFSLMVIEGAALGSAPLVGYWIASLPDALARRVLGISRGTLLFITGFVFIQALLHGHHTAISGLTVEAGGATGYQAIYGRNNATNVGLKMVATYQNGNLLGAYLALAAPLVMLIQNGRWRVGAFAAVLLATILTLSRGAWFSVAFAFFVLAVLSRKDRWGAYTLVAAVPLLGLSSVVMGRLGHSFMTLSGRTGQYHVLWITLTQDLTIGKFLGWFVGWGLGGGPPLPGGGQLTNFDSSIGWLYVCSGLVGLVLYFAMIWTAVGPALRNRVGCILVAGMCGALLFQMIDGQLFYVPTAWNFWLFAGLAVASTRFAVEQPNQSHADGSDGAVLFRLRAAPALGAAENPRLRGVPDA